MKVAHLVDTFHVGGAQRLLLTFMEMAKRHGYAQPVFVSLQSEPFDSPIPGLLESIGGRVIKMSVNTLLDPAVAFQVAKVLREERVELLQTHLVHANIVGPLAGALLGIPVVSTLHSTRAAPEGRYRLRALAETISLRYFSKCVIAVGYKVAEMHQKRLKGQRLEVIPNSVISSPVLDAHEKKLLREEVAKDPDRKIIYSVGRFVPLKGYYDMITAFAGVRKRYSQAFLAMVGDGDLRPELEAYTHELGIQDHVNFLGIRNDVQKLLRAGDMYVSSSRWEGLSMAMLEAMSAGLPVLSTNVGDAPQLLADGRGVLIPPKDVSAMENAMCDLLHDPERLHRMGKAGQAFVEANFAVEAWFERIINLYRQVSGR